MKISIDEIMEQITKYADFDKAEQYQQIKSLIKLYAQQAVIEELKNTIEQLI